MQGSSTRDAGTHPDSEELWRPDPIEEQTLERNLRALEQVDPSLAARLRLPVDSSKVEPRGSEGYRYRRHRDWVRLDVSDPEDLARRALAAGGLAPGGRKNAGTKNAGGEDGARESGGGVPGGGDDVAGGDQGPVLLCGVGSGELVPALLAQRERLVAWDRDPWHLRLLLRRFDLAAFLNRGALRLALGIDWLDHARTRFVEVHHPVLSCFDGEYEEALAFRDATPIGPRALLAAGGLFVDEVRRALQRQGICTWTTDLTGVSREETEHCVRRFRPSLLVTINYVEGLAEFARANGLELLCWEVDPAIGPPRQLSKQAQEMRTARSDAPVRITTYRAANVQAFQDAGFRDVRLRPLAADVELRRPLELSADERERWGAPVAFVGSSLVGMAEPYRKKAQRFFAMAIGGDDSQAKAAAAVERVLADQRAARGRDVLAESIRREIPEMAESLLARGVDLRVLLGESAGSEKRLRTVASLAEFGVSVWGDEGWRQLAEQGVTWRGYAGHRRDLTRIYNACDVHVDIGRLYQNDIVPMRVFDVLACGGFLIAERNEALGEAFRLGEEIESWSSIEELRYKVDWYLKHPEERRRIAEKGRRAVLERHTIDQRLVEMLEGFEVTRG